MIPPRAQFSSRTPFFIYAGSNLPEHRKLAAQHGAQGTTNRPQELFELVTAALGTGTAVLPASSLYAYAALTAGWQRDTRNSVILSRRT